jgi:4-carboxymuconolactone decarboxylase
VPRVEALDPATLTPEQRRVHDEIGGARKTVRGPFQILLHNAPLADHANKLSLALRQQSKLDRRLFELVVITVCRLWTVQYAWASHAPEAAKAGVSADVIAAIRDNRRPDFIHADERIAYEVTVELLQTKELGAATYAAAVAQFGLDGTIDLVATIGYYAMIGVLLKGFDVPPLSGEPQLK